MKKKQIIKQLKALGYAFKEEDGKVSFKLHTIQYPQNLIPDSHTTLELQNKLIELNLSGSGPEDRIESISSDSTEINELYLEPELVATLSNGESDSSKDKNEIRKPLEFREMSPFVWKSVIAIEDQHFLDHRGIDPRGFLRAVWINLKTLSFSQGGSTITQQLVKNLMARRTKNIFLKFNEIFLSFILETRFEKEDILERYLNEVYLGQSGSLEIHGVAEGAKHFFGKSLSDINLAEAALLAGLIRGPAYYSPYRHWDRAIARQKLVLKKLVETGHISQLEADEASRLTIQLAPPQTIANKAPHFVDYVKASLMNQLSDRFTEEEVSSAGFHIYTTLNVQMNEMAEKYIAENTNRIQTQIEKSLSKKKSSPIFEEKIQGALVSVDQRTGYIRSLIGSRNYQESTYNRVLNMKRQVGSIFKPIVYLAAFEKGLDANQVPYGGGYPIEDAPWTLIFDNNRQKWSPSNYEKEYKGWTTLREALIHSVNIPAAKIGMEVGLDRIIGVAQSLGIESQLPSVPSLILGAIELSPIEVLKVFSIFANRGVGDELTVIRSITDSNENPIAHFIYEPREYFDRRPIDLLNNILQDVFTSGTASSVASQFEFFKPAAGKTGTTNDYRDSWFAGFTPELTTVVWMGLDSGNIPKKTFPLTGATGALPAWIQYMSTALEGTPPEPFMETDSIVDVKIDKFTGQLAETGCPYSQIMIEKYMAHFKPEITSCSYARPESEKVRNLSSP